MKMLKNLSLAAVFAGSTGCAMFGGGDNLPVTLNTKTDTVTLKMGANSSMETDFAKEETRVTINKDVITKPFAAETSKSALIWRDYARNQLADAKAAEAKAKGKAPAPTAGK